jgi:hypothetical protein
VGVLGDFVGLPDGTQVTALPLIDTRPEVQAKGIWFARLRAKDIPAALQRLGLDWMGEEEIRAAAASPGAIWIDPVTKWQSASSDAHMSSERWASEHDTAVRQRAAARAGDLGRLFLVNAGKSWVPGAPQGYASEFGWFRTRDPKGPVIQPAWKASFGSHPKHDDAYNRLRDGALRREAREGRLRRRGPERDAGRHAVVTLWADLKRAYQPSKEARRRRQRGHSQVRRDRRLEQGRAVGLQLVDALGMVVGPVSSLADGGQAVLEASRRGQALRVLSAYGRDVTHRALHAWNRKERGMRA